MKFSVNRDIFSDAVSFVTKLQPARPTMPILSGILIEASDASVELSSFDYEVSSRTTIDAEVSEPGRVLVPGSLLTNIASRLPHAPVMFSTEGGRISVSCGTATFTLMSMPVEEFPSLPKIDGPSVTIDADTFASEVAQVAFAASREDITPVLTGIRMQLDGGKLGLIASDRYRVAEQPADWESTDEGAVRALVPARTLLEVGKSFNHAGTITVTHVKNDDRELVAFSGGGRTVTSLLINGNFPPLHRLFPEETSEYAIVSTSELQDAVRRVGLVLEREAALRFTFRDSELVLEAIGSEQAQASETVDCTLIGRDEMVLALKPAFLLDGLGAIRSEFARIAFTQAGNSNKPGPVLITGQRSKDEESSAGYRYLLQPNLLMR